MGRRLPILPSGALLIVFFEFFERFAFYSTLSLMAVYLTAARSKSGFGWDSTPALELLGVYSGLMYGLPAVGGWIADRWLGYQRAVVIGAALMVVGYLLLAAPPIVVMVQALSTPDIASRFAALPGPLGAWHGPAEATGPLAATYALISGGFWIALLTIVVGNALVKATLVVLLGSAFDPTDPRRNTAYAYYYSAINVGGLIAGLGAGVIAARLGWHVAFATSGMAIFAGLIGFLLFRRRLLPKEGGSTSAEAQPDEADRHVASRLGILAVFAGLLFVYSAGSAQIWGAMTLFLEHSIDRRIGAFEIPTQWFTSISGAGVIVGGPLIAWLWRRLAMRGREPDMTTKYALTLVLGGSGLLLFGMSAWLVAHHGGAGWRIPATALLLQALGEVVAWTSTYGLVYRLAPRRMRGAVMGVFYALTLGLGHYVAGALGGLAKSAGEANYFLSLGVFSLLAAGIALLLRPMLSRQAASIGTNLA